MGGVRGRRGRGAALTVTVGSRRDTESVAIPSPTPTDITASETTSSGACVTDTTAKVMFCSAWNEFNEFE